MAASWTMSAHAGSSITPETPAAATKTGAQCGIGNPPPGLHCIRMVRTWAHGGSFNPSTRARQVAVAAVDELGRQLIVMPAAASPHKPRGARLRRTTPPRPGADRIRGRPRQGDGFPTRRPCVAAFLHHRHGARALRTTERTLSSSWARTRSPSFTVWREAKGLWCVSATSRHLIGAENPVRTDRGVRARAARSQDPAIDGQARRSCHPPKVRERIQRGLHWREYCRRRRRRHRRGRTRRVQARRSFRQTALDRARQSAAQELRPAHPCGGHATVTAPARRLR